MDYEVDRSIPMLWKNPGIIRTNGFYIDWNRFENAWLIYDAATKGLGPIPHKIVHQEKRYFGALEWVKNQKQNNSQA